eukprot:383702-Prymnesium_polylepis.3
MLRQLLQPVPHSERLEGPRREDVDHLGIDLAHDRLRVVGRHRHPGVVGHHDVLWRQVAQERADGRANLCLRLGRAPEEDHRVQAVDEQCRHDHRHQVRADEHAQAHLPRAAAVQQGRQVDGALVQPEAGRLLEERRGSALLQLRLHLRDRVEPQLHARVEQRRRDLAAFDGRAARQERHALPVAHETAQAAVDRVEQQRDARRDEAEPHRRAGAWPRLLVAEVVRPEEKLKRRRRQLPGALGDVGLVVDRGPAPASAHG